MIELNNIQKRYTMGDQVVNALAGVSLKVEPGEFIAIMGPSGSGKSTLMHLLGLLDKPDSGSYKLLGKEVSGLSEDDLAIARRRTIGFIFQQFNLLARTSALENVGLPQLYSNVHVDLEKAQKHLVSVGLGNRKDHKPNELSGGQQQRVAIARALINDPKIILADEPTGNLDSTSEREIMDLLHRLNEQGITIIVVTHEEEIAKHARRVIRMRDGKIQSDNTTQASVAHDKAVSIQSGSNSERENNLTTAFAEFAAHFNEGLKALWANKIRTSLSMLGILIGVAAVIAMLALGRGAQKSIETQLASLGSNLLVLRPGSFRVGGIAQASGSVTRLSIEDSEVIRKSVATAKQVAPLINGKAQVTYGDKNWNTQVLGTTPPYAPMRATVPVIGRFFDEEEDRKRTRVAVIGMTLVEQLFGEKDPIGEYIKVNKVPFQVIGILPEKGSNGWRDQDDILILPLNTAMRRLLGKDYVDEIDIEVANVADMETTTEQLTTLMEKRHRIPPSQSDAFQVRNMQDIQAALAESSKTMSWLLASIAAISLLVGGIGIMNIMLVSVTERTREIGLRKALGAKRKDILMQFLIEAMVVSLSGGILGILLGGSITFILSHVAHWTTEVSPDSVLLATAFSASIGIVFGLWPAQKAATLDPIVALRHE